jgi:diguanylate cyclase (GGDEF)-like protein
MADSDIEKPPPVRKEALRRGARTIVVIDRDLTAHKAARRAFEGKGQNLILTTTVKEGYRVIRRESTDLLLIEAAPVDIALVDFLSILHGAEQTKGIPVAILASRYDEGERQKVFQAGASDFLYKPLRPEDLTGLFNRLADGGMAVSPKRKDRVMAIDDSPIVCRLYDSILSHHDFDYRVVSDSEKAMDSVRSFKPDLILMDAQMPVLDGFQLTQRIRSDKELSTIRIVMVTSDIKTETYLKALKMGASDFLTKPFDEEVLMARMRVHLNNKRLFDDLAAAFGELTELKNRLERLSATDGLTGLYNHRYFYELLLSEQTRAGREARPLSLVMFDIDHFKRFNDTHGHLAGDEVIKQVANTLKECARADDIAARYGGEEFALVMPDADAPAAGAMAERIRKGIEERIVTFGEKSLAVTASVGYSLCRPGESERELIKRTDEALYRSKADGRNRVTAG